MHWNVSATCTTFRIYWLMEKHLTSADSVNILQACIIPFRAKIEDHQITAKEKARLHQLDKKVIPGFLLWDMRCMRVDAGRETYS